MVWEIGTTGTETGGLPPPYTAVIIIITVHHSTFDIYVIYIYILVYIASLYHSINKGLTLYN